MDEESIAVDFHPVTGARVRYLGHTQVDAGGFRPEPRVTKVSDGISTPGDDAHQNRRAAIGDVDRVPPHVGIGEERAEGGGEGGHQNAPFSRTRPIRSVAPPATASVATPISVFAVRVLVVCLAVLSQ